MNTLLGKSVFYPIKTGLLGNSRASRSEYPRTVFRALAAIICTGAAPHEPK